MHRAGNRLQLVLSSGILLDDVAWSLVGLGGFRGNLGGLGQRLKGPAVAMLWLLDHLRISLVAVVQVEHGGHLHLRHIQEVILVLGLRRIAVIRLRRVHLVSHLLVVISLVLLHLLTLLEGILQLGVVAQLGLRRIRGLLLNSGLPIAVRRFLVDFIDASVNALPVNWLVLVLRLRVGLDLGRLL